ncbi:MAG: hypothetical protein ACM37W_19165 [Actinomycetota bacterium]
MTKSPQFQTPPLYLIFGILLGLTLLVWLLRGLGVLTFIRGGAIWVLLFISIAVGAIGTFQRR